MRNQQNKTLQISPSAAKISLGYRVEQPPHCQNKKMFSRKDRTIKRI